MGSKPKAAPTPATVAPSVVYQQQDNSALQKQYADSLAQVQAQSAASLAAVQKANEESQRAIQAQQQQQAVAQAAQQQQLNEYLKQLQASQVQQQAAVAQKDETVVAQQVFEKQAAVADNTQNNLLAATQASASQFNQSTSRKRGFIS